MVATVTQFIVLLFGALVVERLMEMLFVHPIQLALGKVLKEETVTWVVRLLSGVIGVLYAVMFSLELIDMAFDVQPRWEWFDMVVTGLLLGGGASGLHDLLKRLEPESWA